jgi:hypothetical protein
MKKVIILVVALTLVAAGVAFAGIVNTKHNLSSAGLGTQTYTSNTDEVCVFCHTPHGTMIQPLWNRANPDATTFTPYSSDTFSQNGAVTLGAGSLNCLSCHDGTTGLNAITNSPGPGTGTQPTVGPTNVITGTFTNLGKDLRDDHPVGFVYANAVTADTLGINPDTTALTTGATGWKTAVAGNTIANLLRAGQMECVSCHEPHMEAAAGKVAFLRNDNSASNMCTTCHNK